MGKFFQNVNMGGMGMFPGGNFDEDPYMDYGDPLDQEEMFQMMEAMQDNEKMVDSDFYNDFDDDFDDEDLE